MIELKGPSGRLVIAVYGTEVLDGMDEEWLRYHLNHPSHINDRLRKAAGSSKTDVVTAAGESNAAGTGKHTGAAD